MPPTPKAPGVRQRRNKTSTAATLHRVVDADVPALPSSTEWHELTRSWWVDVWSSPMSGEFDPSDLHGMYVLAMLVDKFWLEPSTSLAAEIRLQRQCFGLSPIDRRRLQWEIDRGEVAEESRSKRRTKPQSAGDLRSSLAG